MFQGEMIEVGGVPAYRVESDEPAKGGLIVIHEVWGLNDHIKSVADRFARKGYTVITPDFISELDLKEHFTPELQADYFNPAKRNSVQPKLRELMSPMRTPEFAKQTNQKLKDCFNYLYDQSSLKQQVAVIGYCFGGTYSFDLAVTEPRLLAAIPFYGHCDHSVEELRQISCPILAFYGEEDVNLMSQLPELTEKMHQADVDFTAQVYAAAGHAFFNDTNPFAYRPKAAKAAWRQTTAFLERCFGD